MGLGEIILKGVHHCEQDVLFEVFHNYLCAINSSDLICWFESVSYYSTGLQQYSCCSDPRPSCLFDDLLSLGLANSRAGAEEQKMKQEILRAHSEYAKKMQVLMREQRNDILNAISVVTAYLQVGQYERAQNYLEFMAADQFDKCDYHSCVFPDDPWEKIVQQKQEQAKQHQIQFIVEQDAEPPTDEDVKRLIARLMANLVDDAFQAAGKIANPKVWLRYYADDQQLVLEVEHNNTKFKKPEQKGQGEHPNCGAYKLPICRQIASEVGGKLTVVKPESVHLPFCYACES